MLHKCIIINTFQATVHSASLRVVSSPSPVVYVPSESQRDRRRRTRRPFAIECSRDVRPKVLTSICYFRRKM